jgi:hypothetical protein
MIALDSAQIVTAAVLFGLVVSSACIVLFIDWRVALFALLAQYICAAGLLSQVVALPHALIRVLSGAFATAILYFTFRRAQENFWRDLAQAEDDAARLVVTRSYYWQVFVIGVPFRVLALALAAVGTIGVAASITFLDIPPDGLFGALWLVATGVLVAILSRAVLRLCLGILLLTSGLVILEIATEGSLLLYGLVNIADVLLALVLAHLAALPAAPGVWRRRRGEVQ